MMYILKKKNFENRFTFVTNCATTIRTVLGISVFSILVPYFEQQIGHFLHKLYTFLKHFMDGMKNTDTDNSIWAAKEIV